MLREVKSHEELEELLPKYHLCVVGFYSPKCMRCREIAPFFKQWAERFKRVGFIRVNILSPDNAIALRTYNITSPTLVLFKEGKLFRKFEVEKHPLEEIIASAERFCETGSTRGV